LVDEGGRVRVKRAELGALDEPMFINGLANDIHNPAKCTLANRDHNGSTSVDDCGTTDKMAGMEALDLECIENRWKSSVSNWMSTMAPMTVFTDWLQGCVAGEGSRSRQDERRQGGAD
jgi:hypothetical protein